MDDQDLMTARLIINDKCNKIEKLEGWLKLLYYHHCDDRETDKTLQEISDYIKAMEVGE